MKILFDNKIFINQIHGGPSVYFINLIKSLIKKNCNVKISSPLHLNYLLDENKDILNLKNFKIPFNNFLVKYNFIKKLLHKISIFSLKKNIIKFSPNIIHTTYFENYEYKINDKAKKILTIFDLIPEKFPSQYKLKKDELPKKKIIEESDKIICISHNTKKDLIDIYNVDPEKIAVTYLGYPQKENNLKRIITSPYILFVGTRWKYKNFENLLSAIFLSKKITKSFKLVVFGGGKFSKFELSLFKKYQFNKNDIVHIEGNDFKLYSCFNFASAFVYPSLYEGFGLPILESFLYNCPVICSNTSSLPEVAGDGAEYFDPYLPESIMLALEKVLFSEDRRNTLIKNGKTQLKKFSWDKCVNQTLAIYNKLI